MTVASRVVKNSSFLMVSSLISNMMMFLLTLFTARYLGTFNFGLISSATSLIGVFGVFCDLGLGMYAVQKVSRDYSLTQRYFGTSFVLRVILSIITFIAYLIFVYLSNFSGDAFGVMFVIGVYMFLNSLTGFYYSLYQSNEEMQYQTLVNTIYSVGVLLIALIFIYLHGNVVFVASAYPLAMFISFIIGSVIKFKKYPKFTFDFNRDFIIELVKNGIPFGISSVFTSIYFWIAAILLTFMSGSVSVGLFSSAQKLILVLSAMFALLSSGVFPVMSQLYVTDTKKLSNLYMKLLKFMLILAIPIAVGTFIYSSDIMLIIYGPEYLNATIVLDVMIWAVVFMFLSGTSSTLLNAISKQFLVTKVVMVGAIFSVIVNYVLISQYSYVGASITSVLTEVLMLILMLYALRKTEFQLNLKKSIKPFIQVLIANVILASVLLYLHLPFILGVLAAVIVYIVALFVTGAINKEDREIIWGLVNQVKNRG